MSIDIEKERADFMLAFPNAHWRDGEQCPDQVWAIEKWQGWLARATQLAPIPAKAGSAAARLDYLLTELRNRFPGHVSEFSSEPPELRLLASIDAAVHARTALTDEAKDAARWREWLPWMRNLNKKPFNLAKEIAKIDAAIASHIKAGQAGKDGA
jgi:hypothetical protein